jgi:cell filamentation protein
VRAQLTTRYDTSELPEDQYEPGSNGTVLRNLRGVKTTQHLSNSKSRDMTSW